MSKIGIGIDVMTACLERVQWAFDNFEKWYVSFSGGKDSTTMMHIVMCEARKKGVKVAVMFVDLEGQYKVTIEHIRTMIKEYEDCIDKLF